jgi:hypothetical protein
VQGGWRRLGREPRCVSAFVSPLRWWAWRTRGGSLTPILHNFDAFHSQLCWTSGWESRLRRLSPSRGTEISRKAVTALHAGLGSACRRGDGSFTRRLPRRLPQSAVGAPTPPLLAPRGLFLRILRAVGLNEAEFEELRRWGKALRESNGEEFVAAGRAIVMLLEELERLRLELCRARERLDRADAASKEEAGVEMSDQVVSTLHGRLQRALGRDSGQSLGSPPDSYDETNPSVERGSETSSARSWIEALRREN